MLAQFVPHNGNGVSSLTFSPQGTCLASTSCDGSAALHTVETRQEIARFAFHADSANHATFVDENVVVTSGDDKSVLVCDARCPQRPVLTFGGFGDGINKTVGAHGAVLSACDDGMVYLHNWETGALVDKFWVATNTVNDIVVSPLAPSILVTCSEDCAVRTWRLPSMLVSAPDSTVSVEDRLITSFDEFENPVNHIVVHNGWLFAACSECVFASEYEPQSGTFGSSAKVFSGHSDYVRGVVFREAEEMFTISDDSTVIEWRVDSAEPVRQIKVHDEVSMAIATCRLPLDLLATGCEAGTVRLWTLPFQTEKA